MLSKTLTMILVGASVAFAAPVAAIAEPVAPPPPAAEAQVVNAAMEALPEDLRQAVTLREIEGLSYEEIATAMGCPIGTVRSRIFRAREAISAKVRPLLENQSGKRW